MTNWRDVPGPEGWGARIVEITVVREAESVDRAAGASGQLPDPGDPTRWPEQVETPSWFMFMQPAGSGYWLCGGAVEGEAPDVVELDERKRAGTEKLCALLGLTWEEIEAAPAESAAWQLECMRKLGPNMKAKLRGSTIEEIAEWRGQVHTLEPGEVLREQLLGEDPFAGRN